MNRIVVAIIFSISINLTFSQTREAIFSNLPFYEPIEDSYSNDDAVIIFQNTLQFISYENRQIETNKEIHSKIKINTKRGIDIYSNLIIPQEQNEYITVLGVRTIKKNGDVIKFSLNDLKQSSFSQENNIYKSDSYVSIAIPGVEIGDEIEMICTFKTYHLKTSDDIYLYSTLPCILSTYTLIAPSFFKIEVKNYNGIAPPKQKHDGIYNRSEWKAYNLPPLSSQESSIPSKELPYFRYVIRSYYRTLTDEVPIEPNSWTSYIDDIVSSTETTKKKCKGLELFFEKKFGLPSNSKIEILNQISLFHRYINDSINITYLQNEESNKALLFYLNNKKIDIANLVLLYDRYYEYLRLNYFFGFGRNKYDGEFDINFVSLNMITNYFFSFEIDSSYYFLFMKKNGINYELGEIPNELQGTNVVMISKKNIPDRVKQTLLTSSDKNENYRKVKSTIRINTNTQEVVCEGKRSYAGGISLIKRAMYNNKTNQEIKDIINSSNIKEYIVDSLYFDKTQAYKVPYGCSIYEKFHFTNQTIIKLENNLFAIPLNNFIDHNPIKSISTERFLDFYNYFCYTDNIKTYFIFDKKVAIDNANSIIIKTKNDFGSYTININQINETTILIDSNYEIIKDVLEKEKYYMIDELFKSLEKSKSSQLVIKTVE